MSTGLTFPNESGGMLEKRKKISLYHSYMVLANI